MVQDFTFSSKLFVIVNLLNCKLFAPKFIKSPISKLYAST
jgi:hypothetical protein